MNESDLLKKILSLLEQGIHEIDIVDAMGDDLFDYLNLLEAYYIHCGRYGDDIIVAKAKDEVDVDRELVKEILVEVEPGDEMALAAYIKNKLQRI